MILYRLQCDNDHFFDSWFRDSIAFDLQAKEAQIQCPYCESAQVSKSVMSPRILKGGRESPSSQDKKEEVKKEEKDFLSSLENLSQSSDPELEDVYRALSRLHQVVQDKCQPVGKDFAEEVRKIYYGETGYRPIYGQATLEEAQELYEEGIEFFCLPLLPRLSG